MKMLHGSHYWFKNKEGFKPKDKDYTIIKNTNEVYTHKTKNNVCYFIWKNNKEEVYNYILKTPDYFNIFPMTYKEFVNYFGYTIEEVITVLNKFVTYITLTPYEYYTPIFKYIIDNKSLNIPDVIIDEAYKIYLKTKKKVE